LCVVHWLALSDTAAKNNLVFIASLAFKNNHRQTRSLRIITLFLISKSSQVILIAFCFTMHAPSVQLLRALRSSIGTGSSLVIGHPTRRILVNPRCSINSHLGGLTYCRSLSDGSSNAASRFVPRSQPSKPQSHDRGPKSTEQTQTDFEALNVLGNIPSPATAVDSCLDDGFHLDNGVKITGGDGVVLVGGEAFVWRPWETLNGGAQAKSQMVNEKGQFEVPEEVWGLLGLVWPRPGKLIYSSL
jgi:hypothetical protein